MSTYQDLSVFTLKDSIVTLLSQSKQFLELVIILDSIP